MSITAEDFITFQFWWLAIGTTLWAFLFSNKSYRGVPVSVALIEIAGSIAAWPVALIAASVAWWRGLRVWWS